MESQSQGGLLELAALVGSAPADDHGSDPVLVDEAQDKSAFEVDDRNNVTTENVENIVGSQTDLPVSKRRF